MQPYYKGDTPRKKTFCLPSGHNIKEKIKLQTELLVKASSNQKFRVRVCNDNRIYLKWAIYNN